MLRNPPAPSFEGKLDLVSMQEMRRKGANEADLDMGFDKSPLQDITIV
jgi:hypothetical protein